MRTESFYLQNIFHIGFSEESITATTIRETEHGRLVKYQGTINYIKIEQTSVCCHDFEDLSLKCHDGRFVNRDPSESSQACDRKTSLLIACIHVALPSIATVDDKSIEMISYDDECVGISQLLLIKDKLVYLIVPASLGVFVVPLIHDHILIEYIYIYQDTNDEESMNWTSDYPKIRLKQPSMELLMNKIKEDISSATKRPLHWSRSKALLTELCAQKSLSDVPSSVDAITENDLNTWRIVVLNVDSPTSFRLDHQRIKIDGYYYKDACIQSIKIEKTSVFLVISMERSIDISPLTALNVVQAVYIIGNFDFKERMKLLSTCSKLSGIFNPNEDLLDQLTKDICFYRHAPAHTPNIYMFKLEPNILDKITESQKDFLTFQLFGDIVSQIPTETPRAAVNNSTTGDRFLCRIIDTNSQITGLFKEFNKHQSNNLPLEMKAINQKIIDTMKNVTSSCTTVYRTQLLLEKDISIMKDNLNALFSIQAFVLASRSFQDVIEICRQAANNQLTVALFEIKLTEKVCIASIDENIVVFPLGTTFRLVSVELGPDGIWRVQLEVAGALMNRIKDQLRIEIGTSLSWMTFGNYLTTFKRFDTAQHYYDYLERVLPPEDPCLVSIYNNMGLMYKEMNNDGSAFEFFKKALNMKIPEPSTINEEKKLPILHEPSSLPSPTSIDKIGILTRIAEISERLQEPEESLKYYRQALEIATDSNLRLFFQSKIEKILSSDGNMKT